MIKLFVTEQTPRIEYTADLIFKQLLNNSIQLFTNVEEFNQQKGIKINYSELKEVDGEQILPASLLFETSVIEREIEVDTWNDLPILFKNNAEFFPFDIFAATFYLVSRYEEYMPGKKDHHGRYRAKSSIAYKNQFLDRPIVNIWSYKFAEAISTKFAAFEWQKPTFQYQPTIDIDNAYAFKYKGLIRNTGSALRDLKSKNWHAITSRIKVLLRLETDPYDTYRFIENVMKKHQLKPIFFILLNNKGGHDHSLGPNNLRYKKLIKQLNKLGKVGIHPSYQSNKDAKQLKQEIDKLKSILQRPVTMSRQHYLKFALPTTYRKLAELGITEEYSMGYAEEPGFRAGISIPFNFFDIVLNTKTNLVVHPFMIMDGTLRNYLKLSTQESEKQLKQLLSQTKETGGTFISIWHNESLSNRGHWKNWQKVYLEMTKIAVGSNE